MTYSAIARGPVSHDVLIWIVARNRDTGLAEALGLWTGRETRSFTVEGSARSYFGAGQVLDVPVIRARAGVTVQMHGIKLAALSPEVETAVRLYDVRLAPVDIHVARFDPDSDALLGIDRVYRGVVDKAPIVIPAKSGSNGGVELSLASASRSLTRSLTNKRSDASQQKRGGDRYFRWADVAGKVERFWGTTRGSV